MPLVMQAWTGDHRSQQRLYSSGVIGAITTDRETAHVGPGVRGCGKGFSPRGEILTQAHGLGSIEVVKLFLDAGLLNAGVRLCAPATGSGSAGVLTPWVDESHSRARLWRRRYASGELAAEVVPVARRHKQLWSGVAFDLQGQPVYEVNGRGTSTRGIQRFLDAAMQARGYQTP